MKLLYELQRSKARLEFGIGLQRLHIFWIQFDFELLVKGRFPKIRGHTEQTNLIISRLLRRKNRVVFARDLVMEHLMAGYHNIFQI
jgi:hypothetical protein